MISKAKKLKLWKELNKDHCLRYDKEYRKTHHKSIRANAARYRLKNLEKERLRKKIYMRDYSKRQTSIEKEIAWRLNNVKKLKTYRIKHNKKNIEKIRNYQRAYRKRYTKKNIEKIRNFRRIYKYNLKKAGKLTIQTIQKVYESNIKKYGTLTCYLCLKPINFGQDSLEHKQPLSRNGTNECKNLDIAHRSCNSKKHCKTLQEWKEGFKTNAE